MAYLRWAVVTVPLILLLGFASSRLAPAGKANAWYAALTKGPANPPDWAFPIAWTALYVLMGMALAIVLNARGARGRSAAIALFVFQLALNLVWSPLFFGAHQVTVGLMVIVAMFLVATATTFLFGTIRSSAGWLMVPYLAWLGFAAGLSWDIHRLNPDAETLVPSGATAHMRL